MSDRILFIDSSGPGLAPGVGGSPGTRSKRPGSSGASRPRSSGGNRRGAKAGPSDFRQRFDRNELPVAVETRGLGRKLVWREPLDAASAGAGSGGGSGAGVDIPHLLPVFCDGLREREDPYSYVALEGTLDLILAAGPKIVPMLDAIVRPLKTALNSRDPDILLTVTKVLQQLTVADPEVGPALVAHYRHLLPMFNIHLAKHAARAAAADGGGDDGGAGDDSDTVLGDKVIETIECLELAGGAEAAAAIAQLVPAHKSCFVPTM